MIVTGFFPCPVCNSVDSKIIFRKKSNNGDEESVFLYRCAFCDTVYLGFQQNQGEYDEKLYAYYKKYQGKKKEEVFSQLTRKSYSNVLHLLNAYGGGNSILDVGSGKGDFVDAALEAGYAAEGIELSQSAVDIAQGFGLPVRNEDLFSNEISVASRDIVTMFEVIEHLSNPVQFLDRAAEVVKPGGLIYLTTPNFNSLDRKVLGVKWDAVNREHLVYFTPVTLLNVIDKNPELTVLHIESRNISNQLITHYKNMAVCFPFWLKHQFRQTTKAADSETLDFRIKIEKSPYLRIFKHSSNLLLNVTSLGSTIVMLLRRR